MVMPLFVRIKISIPISSSSSFIVPDKLGCEINNDFAARFIEPLSAISIAYFIC